MTIDINPVEMPNRQKYNALVSKKEIPEHAFKIVIKPEYESSHGE
jgi:hypothetical protein